MASMFGLSVTSTILQIASRIAFPPIFSLKARMLDYFWALIRHTKLEKRMLHKILVYSKIHWKFTMACMGVVLAILEC